MLSTTLLVEQEVRAQRDLSSLRHYLVNETARVHGHDLAFLLVRRGGRFKVATASGGRDVDQVGPLAVWLRKLARAEWRAGRRDAVRVLARKDLDIPLDDETAAAVPGSLLWMPLGGGNGAPQAILVLFRARPWEERERLLAEALADCYGHALEALRNRPMLFASRGGKGKWVGLALMAAAVAAGFIPVPLTTLAPAEITAARPVAVTAPFDGIVARLRVSPYQAVEVGTVLVEMEADTLVMERDIAEKSVDLARAELERLRNQAFLEADSKARVLIAEKKLALRQEVLSHTTRKLERHLVRAPQAGMVLFDDEYDWRGRPVAVGERIMTLAQSDQVEVAIDLPVANLIPLAEGADVTLFLDLDPSQPVSARLTRIGYQAQRTGNGQLAYSYRAELSDDAGPVVLGARGTARLAGETVSLGYYLFRRPIAAVRKFSGL